MNEQVKIKSDNSFLTYFITLLLGGLGMLWVCYYLTSGALKDPYPQIAGIILGGFFGLFGFLCLIAIYSLDSIYIYSDYLKVKSIFGNIKKTIYLDEIITWTEIEKETKYTKWTDLTIYTDRTKFKLSSSIYNNYQQLKSALVKEKTRDLQRQNNWFRRNNLYYAIGFTILGGLFLYTAYHFYLTKDNEIKYSELQTITDVITNKAEIEKGSKGSRSIRIKLKSYPTFSFDIAGNGYSATYASDYVANVKIGDTLNLDIMKDEYQMKLTKEKSLGFWDKTINYSFISVYGLRDKNNTYLNLTDYNNVHKSDTPIGIWVFGLAGLFVLGSGLYLFTKK
jgi:hypothetical protein